MAFPQVEEVTEKQHGSDVNTYPVTMPATVNAGDLLIILGTRDRRGPSASERFDSTPSGWTEIWEGTSTGAATGQWLAKDAVGDEDSTTVNMTAGGNASTGATQVIRIKAGTWGGTVATDIDVGTASTGTDANPDPPAVTAGWGADDNLFITVAHTADDDATVDTYPTDYDNGVDTISGGGANLGATVGSARLESGLATDNPGTFDLSETEAWVSNTMVIEPAAATSITPPIGSAALGGIAPARMDHGMSVPETLRIE